MARQQPSTNFYVLEIESGLMKEGGRLQSSRSSPLSLPLVKRRALLQRRSSPASRSFWIAMDELNVLGLPLRNGYEEFLDVCNAIAEDRHADVLAGVPSSCSAHCPPHPCVLKV